MVRKEDKQEDKGQVLQEDKEDKQGRQGSGLEKLVFECKAIVQDLILLFPP